MYDGIIIAVAHKQFKENGIEPILITKNWISNGNSSFNNVISFCSWSDLFSGVIGKYLNGIPNVSTIGCNVGWLLMTTFMSQSNSLALWRRRISHFFWNKDGSFYYLL